MITKIANIISERWVNNNLISEEMMRCYEYGLQTLLLAIISVGNIFIVGLLTSTVPNSLLFLMTFIAVRSFTGGYHADTSLKCNALFITAYLLIVYAVRHLNIDTGITSAASLIIGIVVIGWIGTIESKGKQLAADQKRKNKEISIGLFVLYWAAAKLIERVNVGWAETIFLALLEIVVLMLVEKIRRIRVEKEEN